MLSARRAPKIVSIVAKSARQRPETLLQPREMANNVFGRRAASRELIELESKIIPHNYDKANSGIDKAEGFRLCANGLIRPLWLLEPGG